MHLRLYLLHVPIYISLYTCMHMTNGKSSQGSQQRTYNTQFATTRLQIWSSSLLKYEQLYNRCSLHSTIIMYISIRCTTIYTTSSPVCLQITKAKMTASSSMTSIVIPTPITGVE